MSWVTDDGSVGLLEQMADYALLFGAESTDVATYVAAICLILAAAALASYLPARRAPAKIDPMVTLRAD